MSLFAYTKKFMSADGYGKKYRLRQTKTFRGTPTWELVCPNGNVIDYRVLNLCKLPDEIKKWVWEKTA